MARILILGVVLAACSAVGSSGRSIALVGPQHARSLLQQQGCPQVPGFTFHQHQDSPQSDIANRGKDLNVLGSECTLDPRCVAFNTDGWLKHGVPAFGRYGSPQGCSGLYVKNGVNVMQRRALPLHLSDTSSDELLSQISKMPTAKVPDFVKTMCRRRQVHFCEDAYPSNVKELTLASRTTLRTAFDIYLYGNSDIVSNSIAQSGGWENDDLERFRWALAYPIPEAQWAVRNKPPNHLFVDVGANVGWMTLAMAADGHPVLAFEAMRSNQQLIRNSLCLNRDLMSRVTLYPYGLGAKPDTCYIFSGNDNRGDGHTLCGVKSEEDAVAQIPPSYSLRSRMQVMRMDVLVAEEIKLLKVDVEGFEPFVLLGAQRLLARHRVWFVCLEFSGGMLRDTRQPDGNIRFIQELLALPYRISLTHFRGPFLAPEAVRSHLERADVHVNIYLTHKALNMQ